MISTMRPFTRPFAYCLPSRLVLAVSSLVLNASCSSVSLNPAPVYERNPVGVAATQALEQMPNATSASNYQPIVQHSYATPTAYAGSVTPQALAAKPPLQPSGSTSDSTSDNALPTVNSAAVRAATVSAQPSAAIPITTVSAGGLGTVALPKRTIIPDGNTYTVKKGDTLYSIALETGVSYRDLAEWNGISNPAYIQIDQVLVLNGVSSPVVSSPVSGAVSYPVSSAVATPVSPTGAVTSPVNSPVVNSPNSVALPFPLTLPSGNAVPATAAPQTAVRPANAALPAGEVVWQWPSKAKPTAYIEGKSKGVDFLGTMGEPIVAAADGKVIYADSKLKGYGQMVIVKHNELYLTAYAHNSKVLVQEEQLVKRGQKIAEMGNSESDDGKTKLHFELRRSGKPVDPSKTLPPP
jgi:lipoprotein NlpD